MAWQTTCFMSYHFRRKCCLFSLGRLSVGNHFLQSGLRGNNQKGIFKSKILIQTKFTRGEFNSGRYTEFLNLLSTLIWCRNWHPRFSSDLQVLCILAYISRLKVILIGWHCLNRLYSPFYSFGRASLHGHSVGNRLNRLYSPFWVWVWHLGHGNLCCHQPWVWHMFYGNISWYNLSQAFTVKHVSYPRLTN